MQDLGLGVVVSMKDSFSRNAMHVQNSMQSLDTTTSTVSDRITRNMGRMQKGLMMVGAGAAIAALPAVFAASTIRSQKALGELSSLGVKDLKAIEKAADDFSNQWAGITTPEIISAAYDVKSALSNLSDEAVGAFTKNVALTAKATKASVQEMAGAFTTAYGIFKPIMQDMTDQEWALAFSGAMAKTVQSYKTTGSEMAMAIKNLGATASAANIPMAEQLAILGALQTTMPGSESGTLYKAFLMHAAEAGEELGLSFTDAQGRLKGITGIMDEINARFPDLSQAAAQVELKKAFGSEEAVRFVLQLSEASESLAGGMEEIEKAMLGQAAITQEMARLMNMDLGSQLVLISQQIGNTAKVLGNTLLPVIQPLLSAFSQMIVLVQRAARALPWFTRGVLVAMSALGGLLVAAGSVVTAVGAIGMALPAIEAGLAALGVSAAGVGGVLSAAFWPVTIVLASLVGLAFLLRYAWTTNFAGIRDIVQDFWNHASLVYQGIKALVSSLSGGMGSLPGELAEKLQEAGLLGFTVKLFQIFHRLRSFVGGFFFAMGAAVASARRMLEPAYRTLFDGLNNIYRTLRPLLEALGIVSTAPGADGFAAIGMAVGSAFGALIRFQAIVLKILVTLMGWGATIGSLFVNPMTQAAKMLISAWRTVLDFFRGEINLVDAGKKLMQTFVDGITAMAKRPYEAVKGILGKVRKLLPFSDAKEGPLSSLTASGSGLMNAFAKGIDSAKGLPHKAFSLAADMIFGAQKTLFGSLSRFMASPYVFGGPMAVPSPAAGYDAQAGNGSLPPSTRQPGLFQGSNFRPVLSPQNARPAGQGETRNPDRIGAALKALGDKIEALGRRPIQVNVKSVLDGRVIAEAVISEIESEQVRNYEAI